MLSVTCFLSISKPNQNRIFSKIYQADQWAGLSGSKWNNQQRCSVSSRIPQRTNSRASNTASLTMLVMLAFIKHPQKTHRNSNLGDPTHATASAEQDLGNTEILHGQLTAQYLFPHYLGLVRMATIILVQFEEDAEIAEGAQQTATKTTHSKLFMRTGLGAGLCFRLVEIRSRYNSTDTWREATKCPALWECDKSIKKQQPEIVTSGAKIR